MCQKENARNYTVQLRCTRECGAAQISVPFAEESFDPGDVLIINGSHLTLPGFGVTQENKKLRLGWIVRGRRDVFDPTEEFRKRNDVAELPTAAPWLAYAGRMNDCPGPLK